MEQFQMVTGAPSFVEQDLSTQFHFDCNEPRQLVDLAREIDHLGIPTKKASALQV